MLLSDKMENNIMLDQNIELQSEDLEVPFFNLATIDIATNNFSSDNKLGEGGFGLVYKVNIQDNFIKTTEKQLSTYSISIKSTYKCEFPGYTNRWT